MSSIPISEEFYFNLSSIHLAILNEVIFSCIFAWQTADDPHCKKTTKLQPKDPPFWLAQESRMWSSPRTSRFPLTHMAPPPSPQRSSSFWQPARRSTAPGSTKASRRLTQAWSKGRRATTARFPWKWTVLRKSRLCSRKSVTPWGEFFVVKTGEREPVTSNVIDA